MIKMKDSRIEWIGEIPEDWKTVPIYTCTSEITQKNSDLKEKRALKFTYGNIVDKNNFNIEEDSALTKTASNYLVVKPNDIIINGLNLNYDFVTQRVGMVNNNGIITSAYIGIRPNQKDVVPRYLLYLFKTYDAEKAFHNMGGGVRKILNYSELKKEKMILPSLSQQQAIIGFLDKKCEKIDKLSTQIQQEIISLRKYRKNIIAKTLTKGLDSNVSMKETGIKWIGKIPKNWKISKIKYEADYIGSGSTPNSSNYELYDGNVFWIQSGDLYRKRTITNTQVKVTEKAIKTTSSLKIIKKDFIVIAMYGGSIGNISMSKISACTNQAVCAIKPNKNNDIKFLYYWLSFCKDDFFRKASGGTQPNINQIIIKNEFIPRIPLIEQEKIVNYLDNEVNLIEKIISHKQRQQQLLKKYKHSLIYDFVTGKKQVPSVGEE